MSGEYAITLDPKLVTVANDIYERMATAPRAGLLGLDWAIVIERSGRRAAEIRRTMDDGLSIRFFGDEEAS